MCMCAKKMHWKSVKHVFFHFIHHDKAHEVLRNVPALIINSNSSKDIFNYRKSAFTLDVTFHTKKNVANLHHWISFTSLSITQRAFQMKFLKKDFLVQWMKLHNWKIAFKFFCMRSQKDFPLALDIKWNLF